MSEKSKLAKPFITLDTNCSNLKREIKILNILEEAHHSGDLQLAYSNEIDNELLRGHNGPIVCGSILYRRIQKSKSISRIPLPELLITA